jgi:hypothetical protein
MVRARGARLVSTAVLLAGLAVAGLAATSPAIAQVPGNNGTVKIHDDAGEPSPITKNQPKVCTFHIHAFNFDPGQVLTYTISQQPPTGRAQVHSGSITTDASGNGRDPASTAISLPDGHYKLDVNTNGAVPIAAQDKHKVFKVQCAPTTTTRPTPSKTSVPASTRPGRLPFTGASTIPLLILGTALIGAGIAALTRSPRRAR